jgi:hypothetical protein
MLETDTAPTGANHGTPTSTTGTPARAMPLVRGVGLLRRDGHHDLADTMCKRLIGRGLAADRWAFQVMEEEDEFFRTLMSLEEQARARSRPQGSASTLPGPSPSARWVAHAGLIA